MRRALAFTAAFAAFVSMPARAHAEPPPPSSAPAPASRLSASEITAGALAAIPRDRGIGWDLNLEGALGGIWGEHSRITGFGRARAGLLFANEPIYLAIGPTYEISALSQSTFGLQGEWLSTATGMWAQIGGLVDTSGHVGGMAALGWTLAGVEFQHRGYSDLGDVSALYIKVRIPISILYRSLRAP
ncbi:MAG TPA: hypothetical protein VNO21_16635 [Polyangiaceae bacterium]|nr:hypothetical protein [Polyangiaceae bacterium]